MAVRERDISTDPPGARGILSGSQTRESIKMEKECRALCREHARPLGGVEAAVSGGEWRDGEWTRAQSKRQVSQG